MKNYGDRERPHNVFEVTLRVSAGTWDEAEHRLMELVDHVADHGPDCELVGSSGYVHIEHDPAQTEENYQRQLREYTARQRSPWTIVGGEPRWECPRCGGECFGSTSQASDDPGAPRLYVCHGRAEGHSETGGCGYMTKIQPPDEPERTVGGVVEADPCPSCGNPKGDGRCLACGFS